MTVHRKKKLQIAGIVSMSLGSVLGIVVAVIRSYRDHGFAASLIGKEDYAAGDGMLDLAMGLAAFVFVAGCIAFLAGRLGKVERV